MDKIGKLIEAMIIYYGNDRKQIHHFLEVYGFAKAIGQLENVDAETQEIVEIAAIVHDIGIKISEEKYHSSAGHYQELEGPAEARKMLEGLGFSSKIIERVCYLVGHHHTYKNILGIDYQILVEADFLVNINKEKMTQEAMDTVKKNIFKTEAGILFLRCIFY